MRNRVLRTLIAVLLVGTILGAPAAFAEDALVTGNDVNVRSGPGINYQVVDCLSEGTTVTVTDRSNPDWYAVSYDGHTGFISSRYLQVQEDAPAVVTVLGTTGHINAMYVRFRSGPNSSASVLGEYNSGKAVTIVGVSGDWVSCIIDGRSGYVFGAYVSEGIDSTPVVPVQPPQQSAAPVQEPTPAEQVGVVVVVEDVDDQPDPAEDPKPTAAPDPAETPTPGAPQEIIAIQPEAAETPAPVETPKPASGETKEGTIQGYYVFFRSGPDTTYSILGMYDTGKELTITGVSGDWTACTIDGKAGYVFSRYVKEKQETEELVQVPEEPTASETPAEPVAPVEPEEGDTGYITGNNVRLRSGASMSAEILDELFYGNTVTITGVSGDWTAVNYQGTRGYVYSLYVTRGQYQTSESTGVSTDGNVTGQQIADYALQFVGYRYTWGGASPETGFDCSGLVYYVYGQFGYTMNRVAADQARNGVHVDPEDLQPGDVLCFYSSGSYIGHAGLYIGNNRFVHAANSVTGVVVSELSGYYGTRGFEARRILN